MLRRRFTYLFVLLLALPLASVLSSGPAASEVLISETEGNMPAGDDVALPLRNVTRGPLVEQVTPDPGASVHSPLPLKIKFAGRNNAKVDPAGIKATYLKKTPIDLSERLRKHAAPDGIEMHDAEVPPGTHVIRLDVKDSQGRTTSTLIKLVVER
ncbi:MAG: hypothetical protein ACXU7O_08830 [Croceibacterium sp.]